MRDIWLPIGYYTLHSIDMHDVSAQNNPAEAIEVLRKHLIDGALQLPATKACADQPCQVNVAGLSRGFIVTSHFFR